MVPILLTIATTDQIRSRQPIQTACNASSPNNLCKKTHHFAYSSPDYVQHTHSSIATKDATLHVL